MENAPPPPAKTAAPPAEMQSQSSSAGTENTTGLTEQQVAQKIKQEHDAIPTYLKLLTKKLHANLVSPKEGKLSVTTVVSFHILLSGQISPESLKIKSSSGQPKLDESALKTVQSSVPFDPPPKEMTVVLPIDFSPKH